MKLLLFLKPWLLMLLLCWEIDISDTSDPNTDVASTPSNLSSQNHSDTSQNQQQCSLNQLDISKFVVLTKDEKSSSGFADIDKTKYLLEKTDNTYKYKFKDCCKCSMLKYGDKIVWSHKFNKYGYYYPREIRVTADELDIKIKNYILSYTFNNDQWIFTSKTCFETINRTFFTIVTLDNTSATGFKENDEYEYDLISYFKRLVIFVFKPRAKCIEFKYDNKSLWKYDKEVHKNKFPKSILFKPNRHIYIDFNPFYFVYDFDSSTNSWISNGNKSYIGCGYLDPSKHPKCFTIVTLDNTSGTGFKENDTNQYKVYSYFKGFYLYMFNFNVICQEFRYNDKSIWKYGGTESLNKFPKSISVDLSESLAYFEFADEILNFKLTESDLINYNFLHESNLSGQISETKSESTTVFETLLPQDNSTDQFNDVMPTSTINSITSESSENIGSEKNEISTHISQASMDFTTPSESQVSVPVKPPQVRSDGSEKVDLSTVNSFLSKFKILVEDIYGDKTENDETKYNLKVTPDMIIYKFNYGARCTEVKYENKSIWKYDHSICKGNFPRYIFFHNTLKIAYVNTNDLIFISSIEDQKASGSEAKSIQLDIKSEKSDEEYEFYKDDKTKVGTYISKQNGVFNKVIKKKGCLERGSDHILYQSKDPSQNAFKVVVENMDSDNENVTLYLVNGRILTLSKAKNYSYSPLWVHFGPLELKIISEDSTDNNKTKENDTSQYDIFNDANFFSYVFKENAKCVEVKNNDGTIWIYEKDKPYPKSMSYDREESRFLFNFGLENVVYKKEDKEWDVIRSKLYTFDIESREFTDQYKCTKDEKNNVGVFKARKGFGFNKIIQRKKRIGKDKIIWESDYTNEHAVKVLIDGINSGQSTKDVTIYLDNGDLLKYTKRGDTCRTKKWVLLETKRHVAPAKITTSESVTPSHITATTSILDRYDDIAPKTPAIPIRTPIDLYIKNEESNRMLEFSKDKNEDLRIYTAIKPYGFDRIIASGCCHSSRRCKSSCSKSDCCNSGCSECCKSDCCGSSCVDEDEIHPGCCLLSWLPKRFKSSCCKSEFCESVSDCCLFSWIKPLFTSSECCKQHVIWEAEYKSEFAYKVILKGSGDNPKYLLILPDVGEFVLYYKDKKNSEWKDITLLRLSFSDFTFYGYIQSSSEVRQIDSVHYKNSTYNFMFGHKFKDGVKCTKIMYKKDAIWVHNGDSSKPYPLGLYYEMSNKNLYVLFPGNNSDLLKIPTSSAFKNITFSKFKILTEGSAYPNDRTKYNLKVTPDMIIYKFNYGSRCTEVKFENKSIWKYDKEVHKNYPFYLFIYTAIKKIYIVTFNSMFVLSMDGHTWSDYKAHLAQLDIKSEKSDEEYEFYKDEKSKVGTFTAKKGYGFNKVYKKKDSLNCLGSDDILWLAENESQYATKVIRDGTSTCRKLERVDIYLVNGDVLKYVKSGCFGKQWTLTETVKTSKTTSSESSTSSRTVSVDELVELDIEKKESTYQYNYFNKVYTYISKENGVFNKVVKKKGCLERGSEHILYSARFYFDCVYKVVVENMDSDNENVTLYLVNGRILTLSKKEYSSFISKSWVPFGPSDIKIVTEGSRKDNDTSKYDIFNDRDTFRFVFKPGGRCIEVTYDKIVVWKREIDEPYPKALLYDASETRFMFSFDGENVVHKKVDDKWIKANFSLSVLSINDNKTTVEYYYIKKKERSIAIFTSKKGYGFNKIIQKHRKWYTLGLYNHTEVIWEADYTNEHAVKVVIDGIGFMENTEQLHVYLSNHNLLKFIKTEETENQWTLIEIKTSVSVKTTSSHFSPDQATYLTYDTEDSTQSSDSDQPRIVDRTPVELDIEKKESSDHLLFSKDKNEDLRIYTAKEKFVFNKIIKTKRFVNDKIIWESKDNNKEHAYKVILKGTKEYPKYLLILPLKGEFVLYYKQSKNSEWNDITKDKTSFSDFKFFGYDKFGFGIKQLDFVHYERSTVYFLYGYKFRQGVKCSHIKHENKNIWKHSDLPKDAYPKGLYLDLTNQNLYLLFQLFDKYLFHSLTGPKCELLKFPTISNAVSSSSTTPAAPAGDSSVISTNVVKEDTQDATDSNTDTSTPADKLIVLNVKKNEPCDEYEYKKDFEKNIEIFTAKPGYKFKQVNNGNNKRWEAKDENDYKTQVLLVTDEDGKVYITFGKSTEQNAGVIIKNREDSLLSDNSLEQDFKIITLDPSDNKKTKENDTTQYDFDDSDIMLTYKFKSSAKCVELKHGSKSIWKSDQNNNDSYPKTLYLFKTIFLFVMEIDNNKFHLYGLTSDNNFESQELIPISNLSDDTIKIITKDPLDNNKTKENDTNQYDLIRLDFAFTYKFKKDAECTEVKFKNETIWKYDKEVHENYPDTIFVMSNGILVFPKVSD